MQRGCRCFAKVVSMMPRVLILCCFSRYELLEFMILQDSPYHCVCFEYHNDV